MFNEQTLNLLLEKIKEIQDLCKQYGLENLRLYEPEDGGEWIKINFLADKKDKKFTKFDLCFLENEIELLLECKTDISVNTMVRDDFVERISTGAVFYTEDFKDRITELFNNELLPLAKRYQERWGNRPIEIAAEEVPDEDIFQKSDKEEQKIEEKSENHQEKTANEKANPYSVVGAVGSLIGKSPIPQKRKSPERTREEPEELKKAKFQDRDADTAKHDDLTTNGVKTGHLISPKKL